MAVSVPELTDVYKRLTVIVKITRRTIPADLMIYVRTQLSTMALEEKDLQTGLPKSIWLT